MAGSGSLEFSAAVFEGSESFGSSMVTVHRRGGTLGAVSVDYGLGLGTATPGLPITYTLTRAQIHARSVRLATLLDGSVGYVFLSTFSDSARATHAHGSRSA